MASLEDIVEKLENIEKILDERLPEKDEPGYHERMMDAIRTLMRYVNRMKIEFKNDYTKEYLVRDLEEEFEVESYRWEQDIIIKNK